MLDEYLMARQDKSMTRSLNYFVKIFMFAQLMLLLLAAIAVNASEYHAPELTEAASVADCSVPVANLQAANVRFDVFDSAGLP